MNYMKQKNLSELRETLLSNNSYDIKDKTTTSKFHKKHLNLKYDNKSNKNEELIMRKKFFNLSNKSNTNNINFFNLSNKNNNVKTNLKFFFQKHNNFMDTKDYSNSNNIQHKNKSNLILSDKNENKNMKLYLGNNNFIKTNKHTDLSLKNNRDIKDIKLFSFSDNNKNNINNIYSIRKASNETKQKILLKSGNKNINYRKHLFNEKIDIFDIKEIKDFNENKNEFKKPLIIHDMKHKGLFYLYNLQNNIYNQNKIKKKMNYPSLNTFSKTGNFNENITHISKRENSYNEKQIALFPKSVNNSSNKKKKYNTLDKKENIYLNELFLNTTNRLKAEENMFDNKIKFRKQNYKNKYLNIITQNDSEHNPMGKTKNINLFTAKNENFQKKIKLKLIKAMGNNKTEDLLKNNSKNVKKYATLLLNREFINNKNKNNKETNLDNVDIVNQQSECSNNNEINYNKDAIFNNSLNNISEISKTSTITKDCKYYMKKSLSLVKYIKDYYANNKSYPETKINYYLYGRRIGQGAFGKVNLGLNVLTGRVVAIKSFKKTSVEKFKHKMKKIQYETELMKRFNHKNITKILEVFNDEEYMLIIMEYINGGNLFSFVKKRRKLSEKMARYLFRQIILGIQHIHSKNVVHRDIKLENILIDFNNNVKICDFGIGRVLNSEDELLYDKCGTPMYMAPEIILSDIENGYKGFPVDIWSSGITLYIMLSGSLPYSLKKKNNKNDNMLLNSMKDNNNSYLQNQILNVKPKEIVDISIEAKDLLNGLLNKNPSKRLTCEQILNHPWLKHNDLLENKNNSINLFTKAELTMMSKTYIDYRKGNIEDLKENFTISNLRNDKVKLEEKNVTTKSSILDPFNSCVDENNSSFDEPLVEKEDPFDDFKNVDIKLENDILIFNNKVKEFNINFEVNNNKEVDNGMIIKTHTDISISSEINNSSVLTDNKKEIKEYNNMNEENESDIDLSILKEMEKFGYDNNYVLNCMKNNVLCHASTVFYLLKNYRYIE